MSRALIAFSVAHGGVRLRVRLLPTDREVDREYRGGRPRRDGLYVHAFFQPTKSQSARHGGTIVLAANGRLTELVPHEVTHAVLHALAQRIGRLLENDEPIATAVGILTARILARIERLGYAP
jgi:hypothetical protein